jgi:hypothetical protein
MLRPAGALLAVLCLTGVQPSAQSQGRASDTETILAKLDGYLATYEPELSAVVADEVVIQEIKSVYSGNRTKRMEGPFAFLRLPGELEWMGFRDIARINGVAVSTSGPSLSDLLATTGADAMAQAKLLVTESSKHNLGMPRTMNMPGLPLELLSPVYRVRYDIKSGGRERVRGRDTQVLTFAERGLPPIIFSADNNLQSSVRAWIDERSGALWRAEVRVSGPKTREIPYRLRVEFDMNQALGLLVPVTMREEFWADLSTGRGDYTYSNFRRFGTSARIVPPPP